MNRLVLILVVAVCLMVSTACSPALNTPEATGTQPEEAAQKETMQPTDTATVQPYPLPLATATFVSYPQPATEQPGATPFIPTPTAAISPTVAPQAVLPTLTFPPEFKNLAITYLADGYLWLWSGGQAKQVLEVKGTSYMKPQLSPDGKLILYGDEAGIFVIGRDGANKRILLDHEKLNTFIKSEDPVGLDQIAWLPGSHMLIFNTRRMVNAPGDYATYDLYKLDADTGEYKMLLEPKEGGHFVASPDGKYIALVTPNSVWTIKADGSQHQKLLDYPNIAFPSEGARLVQPLWSADSSFMMVAVQPPEIYYGSKDPVAIWRLPVDGGKAEIVLSISDCQYIKIAPDFSKMAAVRDDNLNTFDIVSMDGSRVTAYPDGGYRFDDWAPDAEHFVVYADATRDFRLGRAGETPLALTEPNSNMDGVTWIDKEHYLYGYSQEKTEIRLGAVGSQGATLLGPYDNLVLGNFVFLNQ